MQINKIIAYIKFGVKVLTVIPVLLKGLSETIDMLKKELDEINSY